MGCKKEGAKNRVIVQKKQCIFGHKLGVNTLHCAVYMHCNGRWRHGRTWAVKENVKVIQS